MTFDLDPSTAAARAHARAAARPLAVAAADTDTTGTIAAPARQQARAALVPSTDRLPWLIGIEELAAVSGSLAIDAALVAAPAVPARSWMGLRGVDLDAARAQAGTDAGALAVVAALLGLGRAALDHAVAAMAVTRAGGGTPEHDHWTVADAAVELDAARLLLWRAATARSQAGTIAMARMLARTAAEAALQAARRVLGGDAGVSGSALDRISRDVATLTLVFGGADGEEAAVAAAVLPAIR